MPEPNLVIQQLSVDNRVLLTQLSQFIRDLGESRYQTSIPAVACGSIGAHVRHILDHYLSLLHQKPSVNYDKRERLARLESDLVFATDRLDALCQELAQLNQDTPVKVQSSTNLTGRAFQTDSSLARELSFLHSHTTHHMAIIRLMALQLGCQVAADFGKAASTRKHESYVQS